MKNLICVLRILLLVVLVVLASAPNAFSKSPLLVNRIEGIVYDPNRQPVDNVYVELLNDVETLFARTKTSVTGRFTFSGMPEGRFTIKVLPFGTNLMQHSQEIIVESGLRTGTTAYTDVYLRYDKRKENANETSRDIVFAQDIPPAAKKLFQEGLSDLEKNPDKCIAKLEASLQMFPDYFDALNWLGKIYVSQKNFEKAYPYAMKAAGINPRSYSAQYCLGFALYQLKKYQVAIEAARIAASLTPDSIDAQLLYGTLLRIAGTYPEAEKALLKANDLAKSVNSDVHWQLALLYNRLNRHQDTITELEIFLKLVPDSPDKEKIQEMIAKLKVSANKKNDK